MVKEGLLKKGLAVGSLALGVGAYRAQSGLMCNPGSPCWGAASYYCNQYASGAPASGVTYSPEASSITFYCAEGVQHSWTYPYS